MTNTQLLILAVVLVVIYFYWKNQAQPKPTDPESEILFDALDSESEEETEPGPAKDLDKLGNPPPSPEIPILSRKQKRKLKKSPPILEEQKDWFSEKHWLSDQEIDWAFTQIEKEWVEANSFKPTPPSDPNTIWLPPASFEKIPFFKSLEATQFMFTKEALETKDPDARFSFPVLLSELTGYAGELVFIPVNNPDFHWSLLVYETKTKKFTHFDTLRGANDDYVKPLVKELLSQLLQTNQPHLKDYLETRYHLKQGNTWDCGIAVIEIAQAISKDHPTYQRILMYTKLDFDFAQARQDWRQKLTHDQR